MTKSEKALAKMRESSKNVSYSDLYNVCVDYFGLPRTQGGSHAVFKTPWSGDPRVNIQKDPGGGAKRYQVKQVLSAVDKLLELTPKEDA